VGREGVRLFVGAYPPLEQSRAMLRALRGLDLPAHRVTKADQVHLTLHFVGDVPAREVGRVEESVERSCAGVGCFELTPVRLITLPRGGRARLVAMETDAPAPLLEIQRRLAQRLASRPRSRPGDRFTPHLTLCRFRHGVRPPALDEAVDMAGFGVSEVVLVRRVVRPEGAGHGVVKAIQLG